MRADRRPAVEGLEGIVRKNPDVYGRELMAFYKGEASTEIIERSDGYMDASPAFGQRYYFGDFSTWSPIEKAALRFVKGKVLDIGCGAGRHALELQKRGFDVLGIDNSPLALRVCRLRGLRRTRLLPIEDLRRLKASSVDTFLMLGNNFGLFGNPSKARRLLGQMRRIARPGAVIIAQTLDPHPTQNPDHLRYQRQNLKRGRMPGQVRIRVRFRNLKGAWIDYLLVSRKEMADILEGTGWKVKKFIRPKGIVYIAILQMAR